MAALISVALFAVLLGVISWIGYRHYLRPARFYEQLGTVAFPGALDETGAAGENVLVRTIRLIGEKVPISPQDASLRRRFLIAAGYRSETALGVFYGTKVLSAVALLALGLFFQARLPAGIWRVVLLAAAAAAGYFAPNLALEYLVDRRQERLKLSLPDALDLLVVCVEAGLGLDQALVNVSRELEMTHKEISDELRLVNLEMQAGKRRSDALRNLADRTGETEIRKLTAILIQTDRFGTSMADALRTHSDYMRLRRRQEAEERAAKVAVKLVFAIFFFILPTMFAIVAGPSVLQIFKEFFPALRQMRNG
jgi:tight adherence protein C